MDAYSLPRTRIIDCFQDLFLLWEMIKSHISKKPQYQVKTKEFRIFLDLPDLPVYYQDLSYTSFFRSCWT